MTNNINNSTAGVGRVFIAYMLPLDTAATVHKKVRRFDLTGDEQRVHWVPPQNYHLTLRFLGECSEMQLEGISQQLQRQMADFSPFVCMSGGVDFLPNSNQPRVMSLKIHSGRRMDDLHRVCEKIADSHGFPVDERAFRPHVTLARARRFDVGSHEPKPAIRSDMIPVVGRLPGYRLQVGEIALVASDLQSDDSRYRVLKRFPLA